MTPMDKTSCLTMLNLLAMQLFEGSQGQKHSKTTTRIIFCTMLVSKLVKNHPTPCSPLNERYNLLPEGIMTIVANRLFGTVLVNDGVAAALTLLLAHDISGECEQSGSCLKA